MKFLLDVCVSSRSLTAFLVAQGHDVVSALALDPSARLYAVTSGPEPRTTVSCQTNTRLVLHGFGAEIRQRTRASAESSDTSAR